ncbi:MAG: acetate--CoA ligase family protein, partial [Porphyromonas gingivalis]
MSPQKEGNPSDCNIPLLFLCGKEFKPDFLKHYIMITPQLIEPRTIAVIGASQDVTKPGGKVLQNILNGSFQGRVLG